MSKLNIKKMIVPSVYVFAVTLIIASIVLVVSSINKYLTIPKEYDYSVNTNFENTTPVVETDDNEEKVETQKGISKPYLSEEVKVGKYFYDYEADEEKQTNSLIFYENTYMQNSGVDYISEKVFDVISVLDGEVLSIESDPTLGNIVKVKHDKNIITVYQGIDNIKVEENAKITEGTIIGTSGTSKINTNYTTSLHFEVYYNGELIDPENFYTLNIEEL